MLAPGSHSNLWKIFKHFKLIQTGGGVVKNNAGKYSFEEANGILSTEVGKIDEGETLKNALLGEVREETGNSKLKTAA